MALESLRETMRISSLQVLIVQGGSRSKFVWHVLFAFHLVASPAHLLGGQATPPVSPPVAAERTIRGTVKSGNMPIPGAGVSATNVATKLQMGTSTDVD